MNLVAKFLKALHTKLNSIIYIIFINKFSNLIKNIVTIIYS